MPTFADEIADGLAELRDQYVGFNLSYFRGDDEFELTQVVKGKTAFRFTDDNGFGQYLETQDIVIEAVQLDGLEPRQGDRVTEEIGGFLETYEVTSVNKEGFYSWASTGLLADVQLWMTNAGTNFLFTTLTRAAQPSGGRVSVCWVVQSIPGSNPLAVSFVSLLSASTTFFCVKFGPAPFKPSTSIVALIQP